jgi:aspartate aminotransferase/aminotransferase
MAMAERIAKRRLEAQSSDCLLEIPEALSIHINQRVYDRRRRNIDTIILSLGEAVFDIPSLNIDQLTLKAGLRYSDSQGLPQLRYNVAEYYGDSFGVDVDPETEILITAGSKIAIFMAMQALLNPGDEVLVL